MKKSPVRRSGRLQASDDGSSDAVVGEEDLASLQPRSSIRAHRELQPGPPRMQTSPSQEASKATVEEETKPPVTRGPGVRQKTPEASDSEDDGLQGGVHKGTPGSAGTQVPRVMLQRVKVPQEDVEVHTKGPAQIRGGEGTPVKILGPSGAETRASRPMKSSTDELRKRTQTEPHKAIDADSQRRWSSDYRAIRPDASKLKKTTSKPSKRSSVRWICNFVLPCLLLMTVAVWCMRDFISPMSSLEFPDQKSFSRLWGGQEEEPCTSDCSFVLVESIPVGLTFDRKMAAHQSIFQAWMELMESARSSLDIAAFYFTLQGSDTDVQDPSTEEGEKVLQKLMDLPSNGVKLKLAINGTETGSADTTMLAQNGADVKFVNLKNLMGGVVHTKLWVVDMKHIYIGSANMDWRSLTQVKELGAVLYNCSCLAQDLHKIFRMYRYLGEEGSSVPTTWPSDYSTDANLLRPRHMFLNNSEARIYISSSPAALCAKGRTSDLDAILSIIDDARQFIYIAVMDYIPQLVYGDPHRFWPVIDDRLRSAACDRRVRVHLLVSCWSHSNKNMFVFLNSLSVLSHKPLGCPIEVKLFIVPATEKQKTFPFSRVNHNKYMVTDRIAYIGTSNWSEDYFSNTAGVGLIINQTGSAMAESITAQGQLKAVFERDWNSTYTQLLSHGTNCSNRN